MNLETYSSTFEQSKETLTLADLLTAALWKTLEAKDLAKLYWGSGCKKLCEMINVCLFILLSLWWRCYIAIDN